ncbi:MAG: hypothetical protein ACLFTB_03480 [Desulfovibrionales bacterium]
MELTTLWDGLFWPLIRLCFFISIGLLVGNLIESLNWTRAMARLASPLVRLGNLHDISGASFSMAFFSGVTANTMLAEAFDQGKLSKRELILSNLFNSLPTYVLHLPTMFFIMVPLIKEAAFVYLGLTLASTFLRLGFVLALSHMILPARREVCVVCELPDREKIHFRDVLRRTWKRFLERIPRIILFTVPIYAAVFFMNRAGWFQALETWMADYVSIISWLAPEALSIVVLQLAAEFSAGLAAAGAMLEQGVLDVKEIVLALLLGNVLSSPMRAFRHQFPYYAGIFKPAMGLNLIIYNQSLRAGSIVVVMLAYALI